MTTMHERFDERFIPERVKRYTDDIDIDRLAIPMVPKEVKAFIQSEIDLITKEAMEREKMLNTSHKLELDSIALKSLASFAEWSNNRKSLITKDPLINPKE